MHEQALLEKRKNEKERSAPAQTLKIKFPKLVPLPPVVEQSLSKDTIGTNIRHQDVFRIATDDYKDV